MDDLGIPHPIQPLVTDEHGIIRFKKNSIVRRLLDFSSGRGLSMNELAMEDHSREDWEQFAQLIGYSVCGFGELGYVSDHTFETVDMLASGEVSEEHARIRQLTQMLDEVRSGLRDPVARLFGIHPNDLPT